MRTLHQDEIDDLLVWSLFGDVSPTLWRHILTLIIRRFA